MVLKPPGQSGLSVTTGKLPVIALTTDGLSDARDNALDAGMNDYLNKPVDVRALGEILRGLQHPAA